MRKNAELHRKAARKAILRCFSNYEIRAIAAGLDAFTKRDAAEAEIINDWANLVPTIKDKFAFVWARAE